MKKINTVDLSRTEWENLIDEWIFNEREREILKRRLLDGLTFEQLAEEFNYSDKNIQRIIYKGTARLCIDFDLAKLTTLYRVVFFVAKIF